jgi:hypothetical protein
VVWHLSQRLRRLAGGMPPVVSWIDCAMGMRRFVVVHRSGWWYVLWQRAMLDESAIERAGDADSLSSYRYVPAGDLSRHLPDREYAWANVSTMQSRWC